MKILAIDDDQDILDQYKFIFKMMAVEYVLCKTPTEISDIVSTDDKFDIGIFDINLGIETITGSDIIKLLRLKNRVKRCIVISGTSDKIQEQTFKENDIEFILKPIRPKQLIEMLKNA